jgi:hypothetical protein
VGEGCNGRKGHEKSESGKPEEINEFKTNLITHYLIRHRDFLEKSHRPESRGSKHL